MNKMAKKDDKIPDPPSDEMVMRASVPKKIQPKSSAPDLSTSVQDVGSIPIDESDLLTREEIDDLLNSVSRPIRPKKTDSPVVKATTQIQNEVAQLVNEVDGNTAVDEAQKVLDLAYNKLSRLPEVLKKEEERLKNIQIQIAQAEEQAKKESQGDEVEKAKDKLKELEREYANKVVIQKELDKLEEQSKNIEKKMAKLGEAKEKLEKGKTKGRMGFNQIISWLLIAAGGLLLATNIPQVQNMAVGAATNATKATTIGTWIGNVGGSYVVSPIGIVLIILGLFGLFFNFGRKKEKKE